MKNLKKQPTILLFLGDKEKKLRRNEKTRSNGTDKRRIQISRTWSQDSRSWRNFRDNAIMRDGYTIGNFERYEIYRKSQRMSRTTPPTLSKSKLIRLTPKILEWKNWERFGLNNLFQPPINFLFSLFLQNFIYFRKMFTSEKSPISTQWRRMSCLQNIVSIFVYKCLFAPSESSP